MMEDVRTPWFQQMRTMPSRGSQTENVGGLAGLSAARAEHHGQFWTPPAVAAAMWSLFRTQLDRWTTGAGRRGIVVDPTVGSGRLLEPAVANHHHLYGCDIDSAVVRELDRLLRVDRFHASISDADVRTVRFSGTADIAILNPPFGLHWDHPGMEALPCCTYGVHGPASSAVSHRYTLEAISRHAACVVALLPMGSLPGTERLPGGQVRRGVWRLPSSTFRAEGAEVETWIGLWSLVPSPVAPAVDVTVSDIELAEGLLAGAPKDLLFADADTAFDILTPGETKAPVITRPVTGDTSVRISRAGRTLTMGFACGAVEAVVRNAVLRGRLDEADAAPWLHPRGMVYLGETSLDIPALCMAGNPLEGVERLAAVIRSVGGQPIIDPALIGYLTRHSRWLTRMRLPLSHVVEDPIAAMSAPTLQVTAKEHLPLAATFGAPVIPRGTTLEAERTSAGIRITMRGVTREFAADEIPRRFLLPAAPAVVDGGQVGWRVLHASAVDHPLRKDQAEACAARARSLGIHAFITREYQWNDLIETRSRNGSVLLDWDMGTGKARMALAMALLGGPRNLLVVQSHLVDEMLREIKEIGLADDLWQVIRSPRDLRALRKINIITYARLRRKIATGAPDRMRWTYAGQLRNTIHTLICDEVQSLSSEESQQTQAVRHVGGKLRFGLSGTPVRNYARNLLPILRWLYGNGNALQPYGLDEVPFCEPRVAESAWWAKRGNAVFADQFIVTEWVTNEFADTLSDGGKREIPRIRNVAQFHEFLAPLHKRRRVEEPEVRKYLTFPVPTYDTVQVPWDDEHLAHYLKVGDEFRHWYVERERKRRNGERLSNMTALLVRIGAVLSAANCPQLPPPDSVAYAAVTSKERRVVERTREHVAGGHRCIIFAQRPATVERMVNLLRAAGIRAMPFHGGIPIAQRNKALYRDFVGGDLPVLVATIGSCQTGLNLWMADRILFMERSWTSTQEQQAAARALRPQQKGHVLIEFFHLMGSIDQYQAQMCASKKATSASIIDHGATDDSEYLHMDTIIGRFVDDLTVTLGIKRTEVRDYLRHRSLVA